MDISPGPNRTMKWGVPESTRDESTGTFIHDDLITSAGLLHDMDWGRVESTISDSQDPLSDRNKTF